MRTIRTIVPALAAAVFSLGALAADLVEQTYQGIRYMSGGIGQDEVAVLREAAGRYNLKLTFTADTGQYLSGVSVALKKPAGGTLLSLVSDGPIVLADVPPGQYTLEATAEGQTLTRKVMVAKGRHTQILVRWPAASESKGTGSPP